MVKHTKRERAYIRRAVKEGTKDKTPGGLTKGDLVCVRKGKEVKLTQAGKCPKGAHVVSRKQRAHGIKMYNRTDVKAAFKANKAPQFTKY